MDSKLQDEERSSFSARLREALTAASCSLSPSKFVLEFNRRADGAPVTVHAARKWLVGEAIPGQARLQIIADWLGVNASWLRYGEAGKYDAHAIASDVDARLSGEERGFALDIRQLTPKNRELVRSVIDTLLELQPAPNDGRSPLRSDRNS